MNREERLTALNEAEHQEASAQKRKPAEVTSENMDSHEYGFYNRGTNTIAINDDFINKEEPYDALRAYFHESRHAYQHEQAENPTEVSPEQSQLWKENFKKENYIRPSENYEAYKAQPVEADAHDYATRRMHEYNESQGVSFSAQVRASNHANSRGKIAQSVPSTESTSTQSKDHGMSQ